MKKYSLLFLILLVCLSGKAESDVTWYDGAHAVTYHIEGKCAPVVKIALEMFCSDMQQVTGMTPEDKQQATIRIYQLDQQSRSTVKQLAGKGIPVDKVKQKFDGFSLTVSDGNILIVGNNGRGCAYGLLELSRMAGVSPWVWWGDVVPQRQSKLVLPGAFSTFQSPSVAYRGIFINDEDWSLRRWASKTFEPNEQAGFIGPKTYKQIFKLLLRLRANTIWPAMHEGTVGFFAVTETTPQGHVIYKNKEMADSCGILIGTSHCEPLLRNNVAEWDVKTRGAYNYMTNREQVKRYWAERLQQVKGSEEFFTIGMRGIHDGSMEGVKTKEEKLSGLQQVINDQRQLIKKYYSNKVEEVPQVFIPYKEVLEIMESGLVVPDDVTLMWCDDNYGYLTRLPDKVQQQRKGGGGVYYHLSYWGRPHDYLWLTTTQPGLIYNEMRTAYDHNCRKLWIANCHDPKVSAYDLELFLDMAWNIDGISASTIGQHLERWLCMQFGDAVGKQLAPVMTDFYYLNAVRRPEFMGWTQVELDKKKVPGGKSLIGKVAFTKNEAADRLEAFGRLKATVDKCRLLVRKELRDAYFAHIVYPVYAAAAMTRQIVSDADESHRAYEEIQRLTALYNALGNGKWNGLMDSAPRQLPVYNDTCGQLLQENADDSERVAMNACMYSSASSGVHTIQMLGHSMNAVSIPKDGELTFEFETKSAGDAMLYTAMIPTQPNDRVSLDAKGEGSGDLRYQITLDDNSPVIISLRTPYRSEVWKQNVLRGQALRKTAVKVGAGKHVLKVKALDHHILFDQWMLDFQLNRNFYVIHP